MIDREISRTELQRLVSFAREMVLTCRVAARGSAPHAEAFRNWLNEDGHGEMGYMERVKKNAAKGFTKRALNRCARQELFSGRCAHRNAAGKDWQNRALCGG
jgi:hypothetical protein